MAMLVSLASYALELPEIFGDNMMLQQQTNAKIWGWAKGGSEVTVVTSWNNQRYTAKADKKTGRWQVEVATPAASYTNYTVTVTGDGTSITINNVLVGEVWFCSGQSNMEMPMRGFWNCPVEGSNEAIAQAGRYKKSIRVATIAHEDKMEPQDRVAGGWQMCEPKNAGNFSACGYFFATTLTDLLDVPVGIINCSWGGSCVEGWLPKEILETYPDGLVPFDNESYHRKMVMYNGMLYPLAGYTIKGFLWNQGESNVGREMEYIDRFSTMTRLWRKMWNQPNDKLPIYAVEIPPYRYGTNEGTSGADFRAAQHKIKDVLENYGCVCTSDLVYDYEPDQIHATKKREIGQRLAYMAATRDYGFEGVEAESPEFEYYEVVDATDGDNAVIAGSKVNTPNVSGKILKLFFTNSTEGFDRMSNIEGFEAQDENGNWHDAIVWATSAWQGEKRQGCFLKLSCPEVKEIKNIRYCYHNFTIGKLHNMRALPVVPFTTEKK